MKTISELERDYAAIKSNLIFWRFVMQFAWTTDDYAKEFVEWAEQKYSLAAHGIGSVRWHREGR